MKFTKSVLLAFGATFLMATGAATAAERGTKEEAKAMVDAAVAHVAKVGWDKAKVDFMDKGNAAWRSKDLYVFALNFSGVNVVHGANDKIVGKDMMGLKDGTGKLFIAEMVSVATTKGAGWIDYAWQHPDSKKMEDKSSYVRRLPSGDLLVGVGFYK